MRKRRCLLAVTIAILALAPICQAKPPRVFTPAEAAGARLFYQNGIPIAVLAGSPEQIGRQHAELLGKPAAHSLAFAKRFTSEIGMEFLWPVMIQVGQILVKNAPDRHQLEMTALCNASHLDVGSVAVGNTMLELRRMGCSTLIVEAEHSATGGTLFGRNLDFPTLGELDQYSVLIVCRPDGRHAFASITFPAAIGVISGMNDAGLAVATLDVEQSADGSARFDPSGVPLAFVFRRILEECTTVAEAETLLRSVRPTTWMNLSVCDHHGGTVFEITPTHIARRDAEQGVLPCTNHFRTEGLTVGEPCWRYPKLAEAAQAGVFGVDEVRERLHAANQGDLTLQTMVFEPRTLVLHLAMGTPPTSDDPLVRIDLAPFFRGESVAPPAGPPQAVQHGP